MSKLSWKTEKIEINKLIKLQSNPRFISQQQFQSLENDLDELGVFKPLIVDYDYTILGGNQRFEALRKKGVEEIEVSKPSRKLTKREREKIILLDNLHRGNFDYDILANEFEEELLKELDLDSGLLDFPDEDELTDDIEEKQASMKITCKTIEDIENLKADIEKLIEERKYNNVLISLSAGAL